MTSQAARGGLQQAQPKVQKMKVLALMAALQHADAMAPRTSRRVALERCVGTAAAVAIAPAAAIARSSYEMELKSTPGSPRGAENDAARVDDALCSRRDPDADRFRDVPTARRRRDSEGAFDASDRGGVAAAPRVRAATTRRCRVAAASRVRIAPTRRIAAASASRAPRRRPRDVVETSIPQVRRRRHEGPALVIHK